MINLWYEDSHLQGIMNGPLKVIHNLKESLEENKIEYIVNQDYYDKNFLLHYDRIGHHKHENLEYNTCFIGPQFWPFDSYGQFLIDYPEYYNKLIVPSEWVKNLHIHKFNIQEEKLAVWPVGIKQSNLDRKIKYDCLVYFKRRTQKELNQTIKFLEDNNLTYNIISYGNYSEFDFKLLISQSKFCFLINGTESQGIAVQEIMDLNVPLIVWDVNKWNDQGEKYKVDASSVPYWDEMCGEKFLFYEELENTFSKFYDKMNTYSPQKFIHENLSYQKSIKILLEILNVN